MQAPKGTPRFLPTLTEVVKPVSPSPKEVMAFSPVAPVQKPVTEEMLVAAVMERLRPGLEVQVQNALRQSLQAQLERLLPAVLADMESAVRSAVSEATAHSQDAGRS
nr:hypothetical protein [uncultured Rhodoferax sp.]